MKSYCDSDFCLQGINVYISHVAGCSWKLCLLLF